jgi:hypothetical protein
MAGLADIDDVDVRFGREQVLSKFLDVADCYIKYNR